METLKAALPDVGQRLILPIVLYLIALGGLWLGGEDRQLEFGKAAVGVLITVAVLWVIDPALQMLDRRGEGIDSDGDVA